MFLTCNTYRQATWQPDVSYYAGVSSVQAYTSAPRFESVTITNTYTGAGTNSTITFVATFTGYSETRGVTLKNTSGSTGVFNAIFPFVTSVFCQTIGTSNSIGNFGFGQFSTYGSSSSFQTILAFGTISITSSFSIFILTQSQSYVSLATITWEYTFATLLSTIQSTTTKTGSPSTTTYAVSSLVTQSTFSSSTGGTTTSSSGFASASTRNTSINSTVTVTSTAAASIRSTTTTNTTYARFTAHLGTIALTSATTSTVTTYATTAAITITSTTIQSVTTPSWWGWNFEVGTVLIATGNTGTDDMPAWLEMSNWVNSMAGLWNFNTATMTTLWPSQPTGQAHQQNTTQQTALAATTTITLAYVETITINGSQATTTTTTGVFVVAFTNSTLSTPITATVISAANPLSTQTGGITTFLQLSTTITNTLGAFTTWTTFNSTTVNWTESIYTVLMSTTQGTTTNTTYTVTTLTNGITTISIAGGISPNGIQTTTATTTAAQISVTTTQLTAVWIVDWSNPITPISTSSAIASSVSTSTGFFGTTAITLSTIHAGSTVVGSSGNFTQNLFAAPYAIGPIILAVTSTLGNVIYAPASIGIWSAVPSMQAFQSAGNGTATYQDIALPGGMPSASLLAFESHLYQSIDLIAGIVRSTATGLWGVISSPSSYVTSITTTATQSATTTQTTTTTGSPTSTTVSTSTSVNTTTAPRLSWVGSPVTFANQVTSTYAESAGYPYATVDSHTETFTLMYSSVIGTITKTSIYLSTSIGNAPVTWTQNTTGGTVYQFFPGAGGIPKLTTGAVTLILNNAAVLLSGNSTTWSTACPNFMMVVIGGTATTTASTTSGSAGAEFTVWTIPGVASVLTSPCYWISTKNDRFTPALTSATNFWPLPDPFLVPLQATSPQPYRSP